MEMEAPFDGLLTFIIVIVVVVIVIVIVIIIIIIIIIWLHKTSKEDNKIDQLHSTP